MIDALVPRLAGFWFGMAVHLWQSALFIGVLGLAALALRRASARTASVLYWVGVLKLLLPVPLLGPLTQGWLASLGGAPASGPAETGWTVTVLIYPSVLESGPSGWTAPPAAFWVGLTSVWVLGGSVILFRRAASVRSRPRLAGSVTTELSQKLRQALVDTGVAPDVVRLDRSGAAPFVTGRLRPTIVLPRAVVERCGPDELRALLIHEREHLRRRDPLRYAALSIVRAAFWFYPPVWWLARRIRETAEMACDEAVVHAGLSRHAYCRSVALVLSLGLARRHAIGVLGRRTTFLHRRLERIRSGRRFETMRSHRLTVAASALAAVALSFLPFTPAPTLQAGDELILAGQGPGDPQGLDGLAEAELPVMLNFTQVRAGEIFEAIAKTSGTQFIVADEVARRPVTIDLGRMPLKQALIRLGQAARASYTVIDPSQVEVHPILLAGEDDVTLPSLIPESKVQPAYPEAARAEGIEGHVILQAVVDTEGAVKDLEVLSVSPANYDSFAESAVEAVSRWRYEPASRGGRPVAVYFTIKVAFALK